MSRRARLLAAAALSAPLCSAIGQERPTVDSATERRPPCDSLVAAARADSARLQVRAFLTRANDDEALAAAPRDLILDEIAARLRLPHPLALPVFGPGPTRLRMLRPESAGEHPELRPPALYGVYGFRLWQNGSIDSLRVLVPTLAPGFDSMIVAIIAGASHDHALAAPGGTGSRFPIPLQLRVTSGVPDPRLGRNGITLFEAYFPLIRLVDAVPSPSNLPPVYPAEEMDDGDDGEVLLQVVVDELGAPVLSTTEVLHATSTAFIRAAYQALAGYRFTPAHVGGCAVPQQVRVPFWFSLRP